jgi:hypothetical protein
MMGPRILVRKEMTKKDQQDQNDDKNVPLHEGISWVQEPNLTFTSPLRQLLSSNAAAPSSAIFSSSESSNVSFLSDSG